MKPSLPPSPSRAKGLRFAAILSLLALAGSGSLLRAQDQNAQVPPGSPGRPPHGGPHLLPPRAAEMLNLTEIQKNQLKALEEEVRARIQGILTPAQLEQLKQLKQMRPPRHGKPDGAGAAPVANPAASPTTPATPPPAAPDQASPQPVQPTN